MAVGNITQIVNGARVVDGGEIVSLAADFVTDAGNPFAIKLIPKDDANIKEFEMVKVKLWASNTYQSWPIDVLSWSSELITGIHSDSAPILDDYRLFYGSGSDLVNT